MFYLHQGIVRLERNQELVCEIDQINEAISRLQNLAADYEEASNDSLESRYTPEGIDRFFRASTEFVNDERRWREDSIRDWLHLSGPELFNRYQIHAELYCEGCLKNDQEPSYQGFREWLIQLRDSVQYHQSSPTGEVFK